MQAEIASPSRAPKTIIPIVPIVPYSVKGRYRTIKSAILALAFAVYFLMPWMVWHGAERTGQPLLIDIAASRFHLFDITIFPQDLMTLLALLVSAAAILFVAATLYGRLFCGFFCFQTLWTDAFRWVERAIQGEAQAQIRLRKQPWNAEKIVKIVATHAAWLLLALATAVTFSLYFADARSLAAQIINGSAPWAAYVTIAVLTSTTYVAAGIAREEICRVACPYGKFQSVMQDAQTKTVIYDTARGERNLGRTPPSKSLREASSRAALGVGDCIDCGYCVNVCPTGVDIRKGFQIDCISCGLCIDACDSIMRKMQLPTGLIRYDRLQALQPKLAVPGGRLKSFAYLALVAACLGFLVYKLSHLEPFSASIQQQPQPLVTVLSNGDVKSRFNIRLTNKSNREERYQVTTDGLPLKQSAAMELVVPAGKTYAFNLDMVMEAVHGHSSRPFGMTIVPDSRPQSGRRFALQYMSN